jgi:hypothetical protein
LHLQQRAGIIAVGRKGTMRLLVVVLLFSCASADFARARVSPVVAAAAATQTPTGKEGETTSTEAPTAAPSAAPTSSPVGLCGGEAIPSLDGSVCCPAECLYCAGEK